MSSHLLTMQYEAAAIRGLLERRECTIDLSRMVVPDPLDGKLPKQLESTMSRLVSSGICQRHGLCVSVRPDIHAGIIRRFVLTNPVAAEEMLKELKKMLGTAFIEPSATEIYAARPSGLHLPVDGFADQKFLFNPFLD